MRKHLKIKFEDKEESISVPSNWGEVPFGDYVKFQDLIKEGDGIPDHKKTLSLLLGISEEMLGKPMLPEMLQAMNEQLNFISTEPKVKDIPKNIIVGLETFPVVRDLGLLMLDDYRNMITLAQEFLESQTPDPLGMIKCYPAMIAIMGCREYNKITLFEIAEEIKKLSTNEVMALGNFYLLQFAKLRLNTQRSWLERLRLWLMIKLDSLRSLRTMVIW